MPNLQHYIFSINFLESWFTDAKRTALSKSQQLPAPHKQFKPQTNQTERPKISDQSEHLSPVTKISPLN